MAYIKRSLKKKRTPPKRFGSDPFYNSSAWRKLSQRVRDLQPICEVCEREPSKYTDHIVSRVAGGAEWDSENLMAMCTTCHNKKRAKEKVNPRVPLITVTFSLTENEKYIPHKRLSIIKILNND